MHEAFWWFLSYLTTSYMTATNTFLLILFSDFIVITFLYSV